MAGLSDAAQIEPLIFKPAVFFRREYHSCSDVRSKESKVADNELRKKNNSNISTLERMALMNESVSFWMSSMRTQTAKR